MSALLGYLQLGSYSRLRPQNKKLSPFAPCTRAGFRRTDADTASEEVLQKKTTLGEGSAPAVSEEEGKARGASGSGESLRSYALDEASEDSNELHYRLGGPLSSMHHCSGIYKVKGPAVIVKLGAGDDTQLEARLLRGGLVEFENPEGPSVTITKEMMATDASCILGGVYVQLSGSFDVYHGKFPCHSMGNGKYALRALALEEGVTIVLGKDGELCHPLNVQPQNNWTH